MTARQALAAGCCLFKTDRQVPGSKGNAITDVFRIISGMGIMTCPAGPALYLLVDMQVMKIFFAVAKTGKSGGKFLLGDGLLVTHKTELVKARLVWGVKKLWEIFLQHSEVIRAVGIMTSRTVLLFYGAMMDLILLKNCLHVCHFDFPVIIVFPVMTT